MAYLIIFLYNCKPQVKEISTQVLVIGGTTSGTSAGLQSAREGIETLIVEETPWLGGMLTSAGVSATDGNHHLPSGIWEEFRENLRKHYGGEQALSTGWVSHTQFEPHVGDSIFKALAASEQKLTVLYGYRLTEIIKENNKVIGAGFKNDKHQELRVLAKIVIDATDLGDGLALAGAKYDLGMESNSDTEESIAPDTANSIVQDLTWCAILKDFGHGSDKTIPKPSGYNPEIFRGSCAMTVDSILIDCEKMLTYAKLPNNKYLINWPRHGNDIYLNVVEMNHEQRLKELEQARQRTLEFVYYIQTELGFKHLGLSDDEFPTADQLALVPYHREGRRLKGLARLTINNVADIYNGLPLYRTGISVGDYPVDHHHACNPDAPEIKFPPVPSFNIPLGALIPKDIEGLIVSDKAISVSNIINGSTRLQPVVLLTGQAAGMLAAMCVRENIQPVEVNIRRLQQKLLDKGAYIMPLYDVKPGDKAFQAIQRIAAAGIFKVKGEPWKWANRTWFYPDSIVSAKTYTQNLNGWDAKFEVLNSDAPVNMELVKKIFTEYTGKDIVNELTLINATAIKEGEKISSNKPLTRRELSLITDFILKPFESRPVGFDGQYKDE